jgi:hypothetical protein
MDGWVANMEKLTTRQGKRRDAGDIRREWLNKKRDPCLPLASASREKINANERERMGF